MKIRTRVTGDIAMGHKLKSLSYGFRPEVARASFEVMQQEVVPRVVQRTPIDTGDLRGTVRAEQPTIRGKTITTEIAAGSTEIDYALTVHEDLVAFHDIGEAKYIERELNESGPQLMRRVGSRINFNRAMR